VEEVLAKLAAVEAERDALQRHYDAAAPEHNLLALLDLYDDRRVEALRERDAALAKLATQAEAIEAHRLHLAAEVARTGRVEAERDAAVGKLAAVEADLKYVSGRRSEAVAVAAKEMRANEVLIEELSVVKSRLAMAGDDLASARGERDEARAALLKWRANGWTCGEQHPTHDPVRCQLKPEHEGSHNGGAAGFTYMMGWGGGSDGE
jgi:hypothetical protein